ncbi:MAG: hypothetical protein AAFV53_25415 [Myxococcota bacterium]
MATSLPSWVSQIGSGGLILSGLLGALVMAWLGPTLGMGLAIWSGATTEPTMPSRVFPWLWLVAGLAAWGVGIRMKSRRRWAIPLMQGGGILVAVLPWVHLWRLWGDAA